MKKWVFLFVISLIAGVSKADVSFKAAAPSAVVAGQQFSLTYTVNAEGKDLRVGEMPDFDILFGPSQSKTYSMSLINGQNTSETTLTFTYVLAAKKEGTFTIPAATISVNNSNYTSNTLTIKVLPPDQASVAAQENNSNNTATASAGSNDAFVVMEVSKRSVYEQEGFLVTFKLYSKDGQVTLRDVKIPEFEGFLAQEIELPQNKQWTMERYNGANYAMVVLKQTLLYPQRSGQLTIGAGRFDAVIRVRSQQRIRSIFDDFFDAYQNVNKQLHTSPVTIDVKPLPSGRSASYANAVGDFSLTGNINSNNVKTNEAVTIKLSIKGNGNLKVIKNPEVVYPNDFEVYDPKVNNNIQTTAAGVSGTKTIEYMAIPRYAGDFKIPAVQFSYFDTKAGAYKTLSAGPYALHVEKGEGSDGAPVVSNFTNRENVRYIGKDIRYLKVKGIGFITKSDAFFGSYLYYICYLAPAALFIAFFFIYRKQVKENANIALVRTRKANKMAVRRLKNAGKLMKENRKEAFYEEVLRAVWGYLSDKLSIPQAHLTKDNVEAELTKYGVDEALIRKFRDILNTCEFARYAPSQASDAMDNLYKSTVNAIGNMESTIKK
ncbi:MAG: BatD family protein [Bacteroidales bacterium]